MPFNTAAAAAAWGLAIDVPLPVSTEVTMLSPGITNFRLCPEFE